jgi:hypothetical protein
VLMLPYLDVRRVYNMVSLRSALLVLEDLSVANWSIGKQTRRSSRSSQLSVIQGEDVSGMGLPSLVALVWSSDTRQQLESVCSSISHTLIPACRLSRTPTGSFGWLIFSLSHCPLWMVLEEEPCDYCGRPKTLKLTMPIDNVTCI